MEDFRNCWADLFNGSNVPTDLIFNNVTTLLPTPHDISSILYSLQNWKAPGLITSKLELLKQEDLNY